MGGYKKREFILYAVLVFKSVDFVLQKGVDTQNALAYVKVFFL